MRPFLEYWNLVFTQFDRQEDGRLVPLEFKNIDTGMGLERVAAILQGATSNFDSDILHALVGVGEKLLGKREGDNEEVDLTLRILADHSRAICFLIADGILPSNEGGGYVLRRLLRRAVRHAYTNGIEENFLHKYFDVITELMGEQYPELQENSTLIKRTLASEEERFRLTIETGEAFLAQAIDKIKSGDMLDGHTAFTLHDTYGFPFELTAEICAAKNISIDKEAFDAEMKKQRDRARAARDDNAWSSSENIYSKLVDNGITSEFVGYRYDEAHSKVLALCINGKEVQEASQGMQAAVILDKTPFYGEMGGQVGDTGTLKGNAFSAEVSDTIKPDPSLPVHVCTITEGVLKVGDDIEATIDAKRRRLIECNHTATHILQQALTRVLGDHIKQAGSSVTPERLRFDFTHFEALTPEQISKVERICNAIIMRDYPVHAYETSLGVARENGVLALFGEKYGEFVRVVEVGSFSRELCGGTHVGSTYDIRSLKIVMETSIGANTRRIEALTSYAATDFMQAREEVLMKISKLLGCNELELVDRVQALQKNISKLESDAKKQAKKDAGAQAANLFAGAKQADGFKIVIADLGEGHPGLMRSTWDGIKTKAAKEAYAAVFAAHNKLTGTPLLMCAGNKAAIEAGFNAGACIKEIVPCIKGKGGGKPGMALAGGKDASGIASALQAAEKFVGA